MENNPFMRLGRSWHNVGEGVATMQTKERTVKLGALEEEIELLRQQLDEAYRASGCRTTPEVLEIGNILDQKLLKYLRLQYQHLFSEKQRLPKNGRSH